MKKLLLLLSVIITAASLQAQTIILQAKKDPVTKKYGYENVGDKQYWWAEAHKLGSKKAELNNDHRTEWVISPQYDKAAKEFSEGLAAVEINGKVGFIDRFNRFVIEPEFEPMDDLQGFRYGMAAVKKDGKYGFIDKRGIFVFKPQFDKAENYGTDLLAVIKVGNKFGCIDLLGDTVVVPSQLAKEIMKTVPIKNKPYNEAKKIAKQRLQEGYYTDFLTSIYESEDYANTNMSQAEYNPVRKGTPEVSTGTVTPIADGYFLWTADDKKGIVDSYGRVIIPAQYKSIKYQPAEHIFVVEESEKHGGRAQVGLMNRSGGWIIPGVFESVTDFKNGIATATVAPHTTKLNADGLVEDSFIEDMLRYSADEEDTYYTERLIGIWPTCAAAHNNMGIYYASSKDDLKHAINHFVVAHRLDPDNEDYKANMKAAKSERNGRRWNRVLNGLQIAAAVISVGAVTYSAISGNTAMASSSFSAGGSSYGNSDYSSPRASGSSSSGSSKNSGSDAKQPNYSAIKTLTTSYDRYESMVIDCNINPEKHKSGDKREYQQKMREIRKKLENMNAPHIYHSPHEDN